MSTCVCGNAAPYDQCCGLYHAGAASPPTAEALMRSRYAAFVKGEIEYLIQTLLPKDRVPSMRKAAREWANGSEWLGLEILNSRGSEDDLEGQVEFIARFRQDGIEQAHHEISRFRRLDGKWIFVEGKVIPSVPEGITVPRSAPCPCGSGKKYKRCCGAR